jgi:hypothetical protein
MSVDRVNSEAEKAETFYLLLTFARLMHPASGHYSVKVTKILEPSGEITDLLVNEQSKWTFFDFPQYYLPGAPVLKLFAVLVISPQKERYILVSDRVAAARGWLERRELDWPGIVELAVYLETALVPVDGVWKLQALAVPKPWGEEIWYTGIEARGQSGVTDGQFSVPLPWLLSLGVELLLGEGCRQPSLLKILAPHDDDMFGDLYFELHEEKREVYVVTGLSERAWPEGRGAIRYGFDPAKRAAVGDDEQFRQHYLAAVKNYEQVRRRIDGQLDDFRAQAGIAANEPVAATQLKAWLAQVPADLRAQEQCARATMNSFTAMMPLAVGDVVKVACLTPHALQHGVRTVEFQTPVYERKILSFGQKVLTQEHWDTEDAVAKMHLDPGVVETLPVVLTADGVCLEQVVEFADFKVYRLKLGAGRSYRLDFGAVYKLLLVVAGCARVSGVELGAEEAVLIPRTAGTQTVLAEGDELLCLISVPVTA